MTADEVNPVVELMLNDLKWSQGCLNNQETDEHPQLYFDHMPKIGDAYVLAQTGTEQNKIEVSSTTGRSPCSLSIDEPHGALSDGVRRIHSQHGA